MLRLIDSGFQCGSLNMAIDEALAVSLESSPDSGFLRFYRWSPPALSFGYFQKIEKILDMGKLPEFNIHAVRRMTGGKMVFHGDEITFSAGLSINRIRGANPAAENFIDFFREVMTPFVSGLRNTGIEATFARNIDSPRTERIHCFSSAAGHSIFSGGKKLVGSAGVLKGNILCFHGSIPISVSTFPRELFLNRNQSNQPDHGCLMDSLSVIQISTLSSNVAESFSRHFDFHLKESGLNLNEEENSRILSTEKYANLFWNQDKEKSWERKIKK